MDAFEWQILFGKTAYVVSILLNVVPAMVWIERRGGGLIQNRLGPNRIGPLGIFQSLADVVKFIAKEDRVPAQVNRFYYYLAPIISLAVAFMAFAVIPFSSSITLENGRTVHFQLANLDFGVLYVFAITSLGVYGIILAGWASNSKYALFGGLRSSAQMISYELALTFSVIGIVMTFSTIDLNALAAAQGKTLFSIGPVEIPKWGIFVQPLGFLIFLTAVFAETNRLPFDMAEGESEIVAGYHLEYGSMKFALFFMAEYINMLTASGLMATLYLGGWQMLPGFPWLLESLNLSGMDYEWTRVSFNGLSFFLKVAFFMWLFVWVRWTLPRFRYDLVMNLGWKFLLPLCFVNIALTGGLIYLGVV